MVTDYQRVKGSLFGRLGRTLKRPFKKMNKKASIVRNKKAFEAEPDFDFSDDSQSSGGKEAPVVGQEYDSRPHEDNARRTIAYLLIGLLWLIIAAMLLLVGFSSVKVEELKDFSVVLGPIITLVSAATGFYYGTKSSAVR